MRVPEEKRRRVRRSVFSLPVRLVLRRIQIRPRRTEQIHDATRTAAELVASLAHRIPKDGDDSGKLVWEMIDEVGRDGKQASG
jgi:hypothetical protein